MQKLIPHLDRHLAIPLLNHLSDIAIFPAEQLAKAQYDLVKGTNMVDYVEQLYEQAKADGASLEPRGGSDVDSVSGKHPLDETSCHADAGQISKS